MESYTISIYSDTHTHTASGRRKAAPDKDQVCTLAFPLIQSPSTASSASHDINLLEATPTC